MVTDVSQARLRRLASELEGHWTLSLSLDLDPSRFAVAQSRNSLITSVLDEAERKLENGEAPDRDARMTLREGVKRLRAELRPDDLPAEDCRALAIFVSDDDPEPEVLRLPEPVETGVALDRRPRIEKLIGFATGGRWCVAMQCRRGAAFFLGDAHGLREAGSFADELHGRHRGQGMSHRRHQSTIEGDVRRHLDHIADELDGGLERDLFDHVVLAGTEETRAELRRRLTDRVGAAVRGEISIDISESPGAAEVTEAVRPLIAEHHRRAVDEALREAEAGARSGGHGAVGLDAVLDRLAQRAVAKLLVHPGDPISGKRCPACGLLLRAGDECPADGTGLVSEDDLLEAAIGAALAQNAEVIALEHAASPEGIAAVTRF